MSFTKRQIIAAAMNEIGLGDYAYNAQPEDLEVALMRLNVLFAEWATAGIDVGYPAVNVALADDLDNDSNLPADAVRPALTALAVDLAPSYGRSVSADTTKAANNGYKLLLRKSAAVNVPARKMDTQAVPAGAGHKYIERITLPDPDYYTTPDERKA